VLETGPLPLHVGSGAYSIATALDDIAAAVHGAASGPFNGGIAVLFDGLESIYASTDQERAKDCIHEVSQIGKRAGWWCAASVVPASAHSLRDMVFSVGAWARWPNLNDDVFGIEVALPIRTRDELVEYYCGRFGVAPDAVPADVFAVTGGVGRRADDTFMNGGRTDNLVAEREGEVHSALAEGVNFERLASLFVTTNEWMLTADGELTDDAYVPAVSLVDAQTLAGVTSDEIAQWARRWLLYDYCEPTKLELLCPIDLVHMAAALRQDEEAEIVHTLRAATRSYQHGSAGAEAEIPLLRRLAVAELGATEGYGGALVTRDGEHFIVSPDGTEQALAEVGLAGLAGKVFQRKDDHGLDGWMVKAAAGGSYELVGVQIKTGHEDDGVPKVTFTLGTALADLRAAAWRRDGGTWQSCLTSGVFKKDHKFINVVIAKAEAGMILLRDLLLSAFPDAALSLGAVHLWTNKAATEAAEAEAELVQIGGSTARADVPDDFVCTGLTILAGDDFWRAVGLGVHEAL